MPGLKQTVFALILVAFVSGATQAQDRSAEAEKLFKSLETQLESDIDKWSKAEGAKVEAWKVAAEKAKAEGKAPPPMPAMRMGPPKELLAKHLKSHEKAAAQFAGTDDAISFLEFVVLLGGMGGTTKEKARVVAACTTLTTVHLKSARLAGALPAISMAGRLLGEKGVEKFLRAIESGSPHADIRARAILVRVDDKFQNAPVKSADYAMAKKEALRASEMAEGPAIKREVRMLIDAREKIVSEKVAPDIVGVDLDGVAFKLSDYKGKIIMLDFWGDW